MNVRGDSTPQTIMAHSRTLFASHGVDAVSIRDIGASVGFYGGWITSDLAGPFKGVPGSRF